MNAFEKLETDTTPYIRLAVGESLWMIKGQSYPADVATFYEPMLRWMDGLKESAELIDVVVRIELSYINSSSEKYLLFFLMKLQYWSERGSDIRIEWVYDAEDEVIESLGEEFHEELKIPFDMLAIAASQV